MQFNLASGDVINAGGGLLFLLAGIVILIVGRSTRIGLRVGAFAASFGLAYVLANVVEYDEDLISAIVHLVVEVTAAVCLGLLIVEVLRPVSRAGRRRVAVLAAGLGLGTGVAIVVFVASRLEGPGLDATLAESFGPFPLVVLVEPLLLVLLAACGQAPLGGSLQQYKGRVMLGLSAGLFAVMIIMLNAALPGPDLSWKGTAADGVALLFGASVVYTAWLVLRGRPAGAEGFAMRAFAAIVLVGLIGGMGHFLPGEIEAIGPYGLIRTVGAVLLVLAVVKYDVLGVPLPRIVVRAGPTAGATLAVLFVVAQVAQNFFSANYGLLMGGVLAGAFVFAASPIQRAIERASDGPRPNAAADSAGAAYKAALRAAMRDGTLTPREERHLAEVATALGITPLQALDLRDGVLREGI